MLEAPAACGFIMSASGWPMGAAVTAPEDLIERRRAGAERLRIEARAVRAARDGRPPS
jgi:hypothetical protein